MRFSLNKGFLCVLARFFRFTLARPMLSRFARVFGLFPVVCGALFRHGLTRVSSVGFFEVFMINNT